MSLYKEIRRVLLGNLVRLRLSELRGAGGGAVGLMGWRIIQDRNGCAAL